MDFQQIRKEYENHGIKESRLLEDPMQQFQAWYDEAVTHSPGKWFEPNAMALATAAQNGDVSVRWVLLKGVTESGIRFFTNYESQKGQNLAENPKASVAFHWPYLGRQIRIEGTVTKTSREISEEYFHSRPRGSQLGAAASRQSSEVASRQALEAARAELESQFEGQPIPLPEFWGGYLLTALRVEFWQGRLDRLHDRIIYEQDENSNWKRFRISP